MQRNSPSQSFSTTKLPHHQRRSGRCGLALLGACALGLLTGAGPARAESWPGSATRLEYAERLLGAIGAPTSDSNLRVMVGWMQAEGTSCTWNPLASTQPAAGATDCNSVGVKNYPDADTGVQAEAQTLLNGRYDNVVSDFRSSKDWSALVSDICRSPWGTGCGVLMSTVSQTISDDASFHSWGGKPVGGSH